MNKKLFLYVTFIGLIGLLFSCEKDETKVIMLTNPVAPTLQTVPDLTLKRTNGTDTLVFIGTPVDPGFQASATYFLEACAQGTNFADPIAIKSGTKADKFKITVSDLNGLVLKKFPADQATAIDLRIRSVLTVDAGTGATPMVYSSAVKTVNLTPYGLPRLDLINSGVNQKIESALGNGSYSGFVKLNKEQPFTLKDPDTNVIYGASGTALAVNGGGITSPDNGWYKFNADTKALTFSMESYMIGLVGSATPNGWNVPDQKMDYDSKTGSWFITIDLVPGFVKFRKNDGWAWNMGLADSGTPGELKQGGVGNDIPITEAGNYTVVFTILNDNAGTYSIKKN
jgi:hypothetical protein